MNWLTLIIELLPVILAILQRLSNATARAQKARDRKPLTDAQRKQRDRTIEALRKAADDLESLN